MTSALACSLDHIGGLTPAFVVDFRNIRGMTAALAAVVSDSGFDLFVIIL